MNRVREPQGRGPMDLRPVSIELGVNRYAEGSALIRAGHTHVLCNATVEPGVPKWLEGKGKGWITAEYSMLPRSTHTRSRRDREKLPGRTQEIQRLIGRALRGIIDLSALGERTVTLDCDVLQADGGTRTAAITGACVALAEALHKTGQTSAFTRKPLIDSVAAVSIGLKEGEVLVDLDYIEDSGCDVDMNFVVTGSGEFIEVQGTAEGKTFSKTEMDLMTAAALGATARLREIQRETLRKKHSDSLWASIFQVS